MSGYDHPLSRGGLIRFRNGLFRSLGKRAATPLLDILDALFLTFREAASADIYPLQMFRQMGYTDRGRWVAVVEC